MLSGRAAAVASIMLAALPVAGNETLVPAASTDATSTVRVALFSDPGSTDAKSREAIYRLLKEAPGIDVDKVTTEAAVARLSPENYDVFILPGGTGGGEAKAMGIEGGKRVTEFARNGKGVVAICAGGYYVTEGWGEYTGAVDIINGKNWDSSNWARGEGFIAVQTTDSDDASSSRTMWFENGPIFAPAEMAEVPAYTPLVKYVTDMAAPNAPTGMMQGRDAVVAAPFGKGRVVAFGPHPELSPDVNHWLISAVKWSARGDDGTSPTVATVLENQEAALAH